MENLFVIRYKYFAEDGAGWKTCSTFKMPHAEPRQQATGCAKVLSLNSGLFSKSQRSISTGRIVRPKEKFPCNVASG
ncbi:MAG: hypothetical protein JNK38_28020 [Acidobacteria bacterium]|nr:hypothetical protein [Acidobacteriota bacterium]